jgi:FkbM family methyltransferase
MKLQLHAKVVNFIPYIMALKNWPKAVMFRYGLLKSVLLKFRSGMTYYVNQNNKFAGLQLVLFAGKHGVHLDNKRKDKYTWILNEKRQIIKLPNDMRFYLCGFDSDIMAETFIYDIHFVDFDLRDKIIIEGGAYIGDTALYYADKGAIVYSFEPDKTNYNAFIKNLKLNQKLAKRITASNLALGKEGVVEFPENFWGGGSTFSSTKKTQKIQSVSLSTILKRHNIKKPYLLHLDIKGGEFEIIKSRDLSLFDRCRIEYTTNYEGKYIGNVDKLINELKKKGFNNIRIFKHNYGFYSLNEHGTIDACK